MISAYRLKKHQHINTYYEWSARIEDKKYSENELLVFDNEGDHIQITIQKISKG